MSGWYQLVDGFVEFFDGTKLRWLKSVLVQIGASQSVEAKNSLYQHTLTARPIVQYHTDTMLILQAWNKTKSINLNFVSYSF